MRERPILFSPPMVRSLLNCTKSQTRRMVKPQPFQSMLNPPNFEDKKVGEIFICPDLFDQKTSVFVEYEGGGRYHNMGADVFARKHCPYGQPSDRLWVREAMRFDPDQGWRYEADGDDIINQDYGSKRKPFTPSIHMPRSCSRILLEIVTVRVERLQDISDCDAEAEGIESVQVSETDFRFVNYLRSDREQYPIEATFGTTFQSYASLWESINGPGTWAANPWVWVVEFRRLS